MYYESFMALKSEVLPDNLKNICFERREEQVDNIVRQPGLLGQFYQMENDLTLQNNYNRIVLLYTWLLTRRKSDKNECK